MTHTRYLPDWMYQYGTVIFSFFRALLGLLLFVKGIYFIFNNQELTRLIEHSQFSSNAVFLAYFISIVHLFGGVLISLGLLTRVAIILQLPVLIAAVIFNLRSQTFGSAFELLLALFILVLLVYYLIKGPGKISMDAYRKTKQI